MLKESEKRGMGELLERMDPNDLDSLVQTVTNKLLIPQSREDAIQVNFGWLCLLSKLLIGKYH